MGKNRLENPGFNYIFLFGTAVISWIAFLFSVSTLLQLFRIPLNTTILTIVLLLFILLFSFYSLKKKWLEKVRSLLIFWLFFFIVVAMTVAIAGYFYDYSYD